jgi:hypothetical protein
LAFDVDYVKAEEFRQLYRAAEKTASLIAN